MNVVVMGTGYVGTTMALLLAERGHRVTGLDKDLDKIGRLQSGSLYFHEPGLERILRQYLHRGSLTFTGNAEEAIAHAEAIFICVGTPALPDGTPDLSYVREASAMIGRHMKSHLLVVVKSTVPVGTSENIARWIRSAQPEPLEVDVVSNPEFLREGSAWQDATQPDRIIIGARNPQAAWRLRNLYEPIYCPVLVTDPSTAEMVKYAANGFLAAKISFINELSRLCDKLNINVDEVSAGICYDSRIGPSLMKAGIGYGGSCFPKDVSALLATAKQHNCRLSILERVVRVNETQPGYVLDKLIRGLGGLDGKTVAVLGLAFKPNTDDTRESPSLRIVRGLLNRRAKVRVHDPVAKWPQARSKRQPEVCAAAEQALAGADAAILCTDWPEYGRLDWGSIRKTMRTPLFIDGRNMLDAEKMKSLGFRYEGVGIQ